MIVPRERREMQENAGRRIPPVEIWDIGKPLKQKRTASFDVFLDIMMTAGILFPVYFYVYTINKIGDRFFVTAYYLPIFYTFFLLVGFRLIYRWKRKKSYAWIFFVICQLLFWLMYAKACIHGFQTLYKSVETLISNYYKGLKIAPVIVKGHPVNYRADRANLEVFMNCYGMACAALLAHLSTGEKGKIPVKTMLFFSMPWVVLPLLFGGLSMKRSLALLVIYYCILGAMGADYGGIDIHWGKREKTAKIKNALYLCCLLFFSLLLVSVWKPKSTYRISGRQVSQKADIEGFVEKLRWENIKKWLNGEEDTGEEEDAIAAAGLASGRNLGEKGEVKASGKLSIVVFVSESAAYKNHYIKGFAGKGYDGNSWNTEVYNQYEWSSFRIWLEDRKMAEVSEKASEYRSASEFYYDKMEQAGIYDGQELIVCAEKEDMVKYQFSPYFAKRRAIVNSLDIDKSLDFDFYSSWEYRDYGMMFQYVPWYDDYYDADQDWEERRVMNQLDIFYREYVEKEYLKDSFDCRKLGEEMQSWDATDENGEAYIIAGKANQEYIKRNGMNKVNQFVRNYLANQATYTQKPGTVPKDSDMVEYFLYENKKGYCVHYASAATIIFQKLGIPARYAEGYIITRQNYLKDYIGTSQVLIEEPGKETKRQNFIQLNIPDSNAHAWTEVFISGVGWVPVETTPGYQDSSQQRERETETESVRETQVPTSRQGETTKRAETNRTETNRTETNRTETTLGWETEETTSAVNTKEHPFMSPMLRILLVIAFILFLPPVVLILHVKRKRTAVDKALNHKNQRIAIRELERELYLLMKWKKAPLQDWMSQEEKARQIERVYRFENRGEILRGLQLIDKGLYDERPLSQEEWEEIYQYIRGMLESACDYGKLKDKLYIRYWHGL